MNSLYQISMRKDFQTLEISDIQKNKLRLLSFSGSVLRLHLRDPFLYVEDKPTFWKIDLSQSSLQPISISQYYFPPWVWNLCRASHEFEHWRASLENHFSGYNLREPQIFRDTYVIFESKLIGFQTFYLVDIETQHVFSFQANSYKTEGKQLALFLASTIEIFS